MPRVTYNRLSKKKSNVRKRRTGVVTRAKFQKPTARNQRSQIMGNALAIRTIKRLMPRPVYTDWQYSDTLLSAAPTPDFTENVLQAQLMTPGNPQQPENPLWQAVLRQDVNVTESSSTRVLRMQMNLRYSLGASNWAQYTVFVVSIRKDVTDRIINAASLVKGEDYICNQADSFNYRLNPSVFKVHYVRNVSLMKNSWVTSSTSIGGTQFAGNPQTTFAKGQVNMKLGFNIRQPTKGLSWTTMDQSQFAPNQRLFLLAFIVQQSNSPAAPPAIPDSARLDFDALYTCYNAS